MKNLMVGVISLTFAVLAAEIALRILKPEVPSFIASPKENWAEVPEQSWTEHHETLGWYSQPSKSISIKIRQREISVQTNESGFRGARSYSLAKPPSKHRVLLLGNSFVFGFAVSDMETFGAKMEGSNESMEVLNLGVPGYGIDQILLSYQEIGRHYQPDDVIIGVFPEGFWRSTRSFADTGHAKPYFVLNEMHQLELRNVPVPPKYSLTTNQFPLLIEEDKWGQILGGSVFYRLLKKNMTRLAKNLGLIDPDLTAEWKLGQVILLELVREIKRHGGEPLILIVPPHRWVENDRKSSLHKSLLRFANRHHLNVLDLTPRFQEAVRQKSLTDYYIKDDWHWTPQGHEFVASSLLQYFRSRDLKS